MYRWLVAGENTEHIENWGPEHFEQKVQSVYQENPHSENTSYTHPKRRGEKKSLVNEMITKNTTNN